jgi:hypothetical protein
MAGEYPAAFVMLAGAVKNVVTNLDASAVDNPAATAY